jgi:hypothetical protein
MDVCFTAVLYLKSVFNISHLFFAWQVELLEVLNKRYMIDESFR